MERDFTAERSNQRWVEDITEFRCRDGNLFLAGIKDLCDRCLAGWSMGERQTTDLVVNALVMALARRVPEGELLHHADHGARYTSLEFTNRLKDWTINASYGSVGDCYDNAAMESTWATIKQEIRHIWGPWSSRITRRERPCAREDGGLHSRMSKQTGTWSRSRASEIADARVSEPRIYGLYAMNAGVVS